MEFRNLKKQYQILKTDIDSAILEVMNDCNFISGRQVKELESQLATYVGVSHCISCANGTDALTMMLMAWGVKAGDAVFVPDFTFFATAEVVSFEGATPVFVDVDPITFNLDADSLELAIEAVIKEGKLTPKVIIPVDLFGLPADYDAITRIAQKYELKVLEDGAQGFGGKYKDQRACSFGDAATTSFFPAKPLGCYGDGGAIFTNDDNINDYLRSIAVHGKGTYKYDNVRIGWNSRLDTIQAAILLVKLTHFKEFELTSINEKAMLYTKLLADVCKTPEIPKEYSSSWAQYTIQLASEEQRDRVKELLLQHGIPSMIYYPKVLHEQTAFKQESVYVSTPIATDLTKKVLALPLDPYKSEQEISLIASVVKEGCLS